MIAIWNRKEVHIGYSMKKFNEARNILKNNNIDYKYKLVDHNSTYLFSSRRTRTGTFGENLDYSTEYYIYVHKKDYDNARYLLSNY